jgi:hypothetical protein
MTNLTASDDPWRNLAWIDRTRVLLDSYRRWLGRDLIPRSGDATEDSRQLFEAPFVVVAHGTEADPILNYANRTALDLWETDLPTLLSTPSRKTAEPVHRDERAGMLAQAARDGYIDNYRGIRISTTGRRFRIEQAIIWNLVSDDGQPAGQAATFERCGERGNSGERPA